MVQRNSTAQIHENITAFIDAYDEAMLLLDRSTKPTKIEVELNNYSRYKEISIRGTDEGFELTPITMTKRANSKRQIQNFFSSLVEQKQTDSSDIPASPEINNPRTNNIPHPTHDDSEECSWADGAQVVSKCILAGVNLLKHRIEHKIEDVLPEIEYEGEVCKEQIKTQKELQRKEDGHNDLKSTALDPRMNEIVILTSDNVDKASHELRDNTTKIALGIRDKVTNEVVKIADEMEEAEIGKLLIPNEESREILAAFGKVALTALGAAQIVFGTMHDSTEAVAMKSNEVAADVISYKYGSTAGRVVEDTGDSIYTAFRALKLFFDVQSREYGSGGC